ncbi:MAG: non-ribosomal peptide synthetase, partial [Limisphaerales bacterium]
MRTRQDAPALLELPADHPRPARTPGTGARQPVFFPISWLKSVEALGRQQDCDLFTTLLAGFSTLLHRYSRAEDMVIGSLATTQLQAGMDQLVANFETPMALRCNLAGDPTFLELLARVKRTVTEALAHSSMPFAKLIDLLQPERHGSFARVFQVMLVLEGGRPESSESAGLRFSPFEIDNGTAKLDLCLHMAPTPDGLSGWIEYSTPLFDSTRIERMAQHLGTLLASAATQPSLPISRLGLLADSERQRILVEWTRTEKDYPRSKTIVNLFREQAARTPDAEALVVGHERVTYRELEARACALAGRLLGRGLQREDLVGICLDRSAEMLVSMLAALMAGAAYVPLDPAYPQERLTAIAQDAKLRFVLTRRRFRGLVSCEESEMLCLDEPAEEREPRLAPTVTGDPSSLAYVIYTSGSTGRPKGVALEHRNAVAFVSWARDTFAPEDLAGVLASTSICFDLSVFEIFVPLACGGKIILAENALALPSLPAAAEVTLINTVPSAMAELLRAQAVPRSVRVINLAGEPLSAGLVDQIYKETAALKVYDLYGPTETTTYSTGALRRPAAPATIGKPLANEQVYLLDGHLQP